MKLTLNFNGDSDGFNLEMDLDISIREDAEALGYITSILFASGKKLSEVCKESNPIYHERIKIGIQKSIKDKLPEDTNYPFTTYLLHME